MLLDTPFLTRARLSAVALLTICAVGIASANYRVQIALAILGLLVEVFVIGYFRFEPGLWSGR